MSERPDHELEELAKDLFDAGRDEAPSAAAKARALAALGLDAPVGGAAPDGAPPEPPAPPPTPAPTAAGTSTALKAGAALVVVGTLAFLALRPSPAPAPDPAPASASALAPASPSASASASAPGPAPAPAPAPASPSSSSPSPSPSASPSPVSSPRAPADDLAAELAALDRARRAIRAGDPDQGLAELDAHAKRYPTGSLRSEALVLRVEALMKAGREAEARRVAAPWLAAHPEDVASRRIRGLLPPP